jgi:hypothetical protein
MIFMRVLVALLALVVSVAAQADDMAYTTTNLGNFGTLDLSTGMYTQIGNMGVQLAGLGVSGGNIYGIDDTLSSYTLDEVNPATGAVTTIGTTAFSFGVAAFGSTPGGMFILDNDGGLWEVSATTGFAQYIGATGLTLTPNAVGLSNNSSTLYLSDGIDLYTVNISDGAATEVGNPPGNNLPTYFSQMLFENGTLYGVSNVVLQSGQSVYDLTSGFPSSANVLTLAGNVIGLAPDPLPVPVSPVPERQNLVLLVTGLVLIGIVIDPSRPRSRALSIFTMVIAREDGFNNRSKA